LITPLSYSHWITLMITTVWMQVLLFACAVGAFPFDGQNEDEVKRKIQRAAVDIPGEKQLVVCVGIRRGIKAMTTAASLSVELRELLKGMLCKDPDKRFTIEQVIAHPWLCQGICERFFVDEYMQHVTNQVASGAYPSLAGGVAGSASGGDGTRSTTPVSSSRSTSTAMTPSRPASVLGKPLDHPPKVGSPKPVSLHRPHTPAAQISRSSRSGAETPISMTEWRTARTEQKSVPPPVPPASSKVRALSAGTSNRASQSSRSVGSKAPSTESKAPAALIRGAFSPPQDVSRMRRLEVIHVASIGAAELRSSTPATATTPQAKRTVAEGFPRARTPGTPALQADPLVASHSASAPGTSVHVLVGHQSTPVAKRAISPAVSASTGMRSRSPSLSKTPLVPPTAVVRTRYVDRVRGASVEPAPATPAVPTGSNQRSGANTPSFASSLRSGRLTAATPPPTPARRPAKALAADSTVMKSPDPSKQAQLSPATVHKPAEKPVLSRPSLVARSSGSALRQPAHAQPAPNTPSARPQTPLYPRAIYQRSNKPVSITSNALVTAPRGTSPRVASSPYDPSRRVANATPTAKNTAVVDTAWLSSGRFLSRSPVTTSSVSRVSPSAAAALKQYDPDGDVTDSLARLYDEISALDRAIADNTEEAGLIPQSQLPSSMDDSQHVEQPIVKAQLHPFDGHHSLDIYNDFL
jgi:hypothetical protein